MAARSNSCGYDSILEEELDVLRAIYIHELVVERDDSGHPHLVYLTLHPATGDDVAKQFVCMAVHFKLAPSYPENIPEIIIKNPRGLAEEEVHSLQEDMHTLARDMCGGAMLFELIEMAKEILTEGNIPRCPCVVCLEHFHDGDDFTRTDCYHYFHFSCLARYVEHALTQNATVKVTHRSRTFQQEDQHPQVVCPVCRTSIQYDLEELKQFPSVEDEAVAFERSVEMVKLQEDMRELFVKQKAKGGIIDLEEEKNKYLVNEDTVVTLKVDIPVEPDPVKKAATEPERNTANCVQDRRNYRNNNVVAKYKGFPRRGRPSSGRANGRDSDCAPRDQEIKFMGNKSVSNRTTKHERTSEGGERRDGYERVSSFGRRDRDTQRKYTQRKEQGSDRRNRPEWRENGYMSNDKTVKSQSMNTGKNINPEPHLADGDVETKCTSHYATKRGGSKKFHDKGDKSLTGNGVDDGLSPPGPGPLETHGFSDNEICSNGNEKDGVKCGTKSGEMGKCEDWDAERVNVDGSKSKHGYFEEKRERDIDPSKSGTMRSSMQSTSEVDEIIKSDGNLDKSHEKDPKQRSSEDWDREITPLNHDKKHQRQYGGQRRTSRDGNKVFSKHEDGGEQRRIDNSKDGMESDRRHRGDRQLEERCHSHGGNREPRQDSGRNRHRGSHSEGWGGNRQQGERRRGEGGTVQQDARHNRHSEAKYDRHSEAKYDRHSEAKYDRHSEAKYDRHSEAKYDRHSEAKYDRHSEAKYDHDSETRHMHQSDSRHNHHLEARHKHQTDARYEHDLENKYKHQTDSKYEHDSEARHKQISETKHNHHTETRYEHDSEARHKQISETKHNHHTETRYNNDSRARHKHQSDARHNRRSNHHSPHWGDDWERDVPHEDSAQQRGQKRMVKAHDEVQKVDPTKSISGKFEKDVPVKNQGKEWNSGMENTCLKQEEGKEPDGETREGGDSHRGSKTPSEKSPRERKDKEKLFQHDRHGDAGISKGEKPHARRKDSAKKENWDDDNAHRGRRGQDRSMRAISTNSEDWDRDDGRGRSKREWTSGNRGQSRPGRGRATPRGREERGCKNKGRSRKEEEEDYGTSSIHSDEHGDAKPSKCEDVPQTSQPPEWIPEPARSLPSTIHAPPGLQASTPPGFGSGRGQCSSTHDMLCASNSPQSKDVHNTSQPTERNHEPVLCFPPEITAPPEIQTSGPPGFGFVGGQSSSSCVKPPPGFVVR